MMISNEGAYFDIQYSLFPVRLARPDDRSDGRQPGGLVHYSL